MKNFSPCEERRRQRAEVMKTATSIAPGPEKMATVRMFQAKAIAVKISCP
jgi:hypothetical protein